MKAAQRKIIKFNLMKFSLATIVAVLLVGCAKPTDQNYNDTVKAMNQELLANTENKKRVQNKARQLSLPSSVTAQMMPTSLALPGVKNKTIATRFDVSVNNVTAKEFFKGLAQGANCSLMLSPDVKGNITLSLKQVTLLEVLDAVSNLYDYNYEKTSYGYNIYPKKLETRIFMIDKLTLSRTLQTITQLNGSSGDLTQASSSSSGGTATISPSTLTIQATKKDTFWADILSTIQAMIGASGDKGSATDTPTAQLNVETGMLIVRAYPKDMKMVEQYITKTQRILGREVIIEAEILDVTLSNTYSAGIDWGALSAGSVTSAATETSPTAGFLSSAYTLNLSGDRNNFNYVLNLVSTQGKVSVLSRPRVSAINNQSAIIKVGSDDYYVTNVQSQVTTGGSGESSNTTTSTINLQAFFSGISLYVTPQITDDGTVNLHIHPSVSKVTENTLNVTVDGQESQLPVAQSVTRETDTVVRAKNGQVIILGGLMQSDIAVSSSGLPLSDDYKNSLGAATSAQANNGIKSELVILLRAIYVDDDAWNSELDKTSKAAFSKKSEQEFFANARGN